MHPDASMVVPNPFFARFWLTKSHPLLAYTLVPSQDFALCIVPPFRSPWVDVLPSSTLPTPDMPSTSSPLGRLRMLSRSPKHPGTSPTSLCLLRQFVVTCPR